MKDLLLLETSVSPNVLDDFAISKRETLHSCTQLHIPNGLELTKGRL